MWHIGHLVDKSQRWRDAHWALRWPEQLKAGRCACLLSAAGIPVVMILYDLYDCTTPLSYILDRFRFYHKFCKIALVSPTCGFTFMFVGFKKWIMRGKSWCQVSASIYQFTFSVNCWCCTVSNVQYQLYTLE